MCIDAYACGGRRPHVGSTLGFFCFARQAAADVDNDMNVIIVVQPAQLGFSLRGKHAQRTHGGGSSSSSRYNIRIVEWRA